MNIVKAQKDVFAQLVKGERVCRFAVDDTHTFVTPDGYHGWVFPNALIAFNLEKTPEFVALKTKELINEENQLEITCEFRNASFTDKRLLRKLKRGNIEVFVQEKFLSYFQNPGFYQEKGNRLSHIVITETVNKTSAPEPVGIVLPVRFSNDIKE